MRTTFRFVPLLLALAALAAAPARGADTITICKKTIPAGGTGFSFSGTQPVFVLNDGQCKTVDLTHLDHYQKFTESVPPGWTLTNIACTYQTSSVSILGADPNPGFQPGDTTVSIDLNEPNVTCTFTNQSTSAATYKDVYTVKFLCGSLQAKPQAVKGGEWPVKPGNYLTAINVHNPNDVPLTFRKKALRLYQADQRLVPEKPMAPGELIRAELQPDYGFVIDCTDIRRVLLKNTIPAPTFFEGVVVVEVGCYETDPPPLDIITAYTSHGWNMSGDKAVYEGFALDVEPTLPKRVRCGAK